MIIDVHGQLRGGRPKRIGRIDLEDSPFEKITSFSGSYHVLEVSEHFRAYHTATPLLVSSTSEHPELTRCERLTHKLQSGEIRGNAGEAMASLFFYEYLRLNACDIIHLTRRQKTETVKTPDYLVRLGSHANARVLSHFWSPIGWYLPPQEWWPVEVKTRSTKPQKAYNDALTQLASFWRYESKVGLLFGHGLVLTFLDQGSPQLHCRVVMPRPGTTTAHRDAAKSALSGIPGKLTYEKVTKALAGYI